MGFWNEEVLETAEKQGGNFEPLPAGDYRMMLTDSEIKTTKAGDGNYLSLKFEITGPTNEGRLVFDNVTVNNKNSQAVGIGLGHLKELSTACNQISWYEKLKSVGDWEEAESVLNTIFDSLGNIEVVGKLKIRKSEQYGDSNDIKGFKASDNIPEFKSATNAPGKQAAKGAVPWED